MNDTKYLSLEETLLWIAYGDRKVPESLKGVATYERAEKDLHNKILSGQIKILGRPREHAPHEEIPVLELEDPLFDPTENIVWRTADPFQPDTKRWINVKFDRHQVLKVWPTPPALTGKKIGRPPTYPDIDYLVDLLLGSLEKEHGKTWFKEQTTGTLEKEIRKKHSKLKSPAAPLPGSTTLVKMINAWLRSKRIPIKRRKKRGEARQIS